VPLYRVEETPKQKPFHFVSGLAFWMQLFLNCSILKKQERKDENLPVMKWRAAQEQ
jgi:hypothetical protein